MNGSTPLIVAALSSLFFAGTLLALLRSVQGPLTRHLETTAPQTARLGTVFTVFLVPMMLVAGLLVDKWGAQAVLIVGASAAALGLSALARSATPWAAVTGVLLLAGGTAGLTVAGFTVLPQALYPRSAVASASVGSSCFALGVLLAPIVGGRFERGWGFRTGLLCLALVCLTPAVFAAAISSGELANPQPAADRGSLLHHPGLWCAALAMLLYQPLEEALGSWFSGYLKDVGVPEQTATVWLGLCWVVFLGMRLLSGAAIRPGFEPWWILLLALTTAVCLGNLVGSYRPTGSGLGLLLLAACIAPVFPALIGLVLRWFPADAGSACGFVFAVGTAGRVVVPSLLSPSSTRHAPRTAMWLSRGFTLPLAAAGLVLALLN
jgi:fucose permease